MTMPSLGGKDAFAAMKVGRPQIRALFMSGWFDPEEQERFAARSQPIITKPFSKEQLLRAVRKALDGPEPQPLN